MAGYPAHIAGEIHALSSPSGSMSKRARKAAQARLEEKIAAFNAANGITGYRGERSLEEQRRGQREADLNYAQFLDGLADHGMRPRVYRKEAARLRAKWEAIQG